MKKIEFSRQAGVSHVAITKACRTLLKAALVDNGKRIDAGHPDAVAYLAKERVAKPPPVVAKEKRGASAGTVESPLAVPKYIRGFLKLTLEEIVERFGTETRFLDCLNATQKIEMIHEKRLKNARIERELVSSKMVKECIIDVFEGAHLALMTDGAKSIAAGAVSKHVSGSEQEEVERYVSDIISSHLKNLQINAMRALAEY